MLSTVITIGKTIVKQTSRDSGTIHFNAEYDLKQPRPPPFLSENYTSKNTIIYLYTFTISSQGYKNTTLEEINC